jgi:Domain of unknown function DUF29
VSKIAAKPPANELYEADFYARTQEQARLLRERRWDVLDLANLVDEVESVGRSDKRQIESRLETPQRVLDLEYYPQDRETE